MHERARAMLDFWFGAPGDPGREQHRPIWFNGSPEFDAEVRRHFLVDYEAAVAGHFADWESEPESALALLLLLDQVPRNIFRDTPRAYDTDSAACVVADRALARRFDQAVPAAWRIFFYMPLHHSEDLAKQRRSVALFAALPGDRGSGGLRRYGEAYVDVIARFGRFPHRNVILGRESTEAETAFLAECDLRRQQAQK
ncbi:MAG TPA: DUF924 family protein [Stellaceae bacterium]|nr:DUF924 family protein [Stellaceae bacterium]